MKYHDHLHFMNEETEAWGSGIGARWQFLGAHLGCTHRSV